MSVSVGCAAVPEDMVIKIRQSQDTWRGTNQQVHEAAVVLEEPWKNVKQLTSPNPRALGLFREYKFTTVHLSGGLDHVSPNLTADIPHRSNYLPQVIYCSNK